MDLRGGRQQYAPNLLLCAQGVGIALVRGYNNTFGHRMEYARPDLGELLFGIVGEVAPEYPAAIIQTVAQYGRRADT